MHSAVEAHMTLRSVNTANCIICLCMTRLLEQFWRNDKAPMNNIMCSATADSCARPEAEALSAPETALMQCASASVQEIAKMVYALLGG